MNRPISHLHAGCTCPEFQTHSCIPLPGSQKKKKGSWKILKIEVRRSWCQSGSETTCRGRSSELFNKVQSLYEIPQPEHMEVVDRSDLPCFYCSVNMTALMCVWGGIFSFVYLSEYPVGLFLCGLIGLNHSGAAGQTHSLKTLGGISIRGFSPCLHESQV